MYLSHLQPAGSNYGAKNQFFKENYRAKIGPNSIILVGADVPEKKSAKLSKKGSSPRAKNDPKNDRIFRFEGDHRQLGGPNPRRKVRLAA